MKGLGSVRIVLATIAIGVGSDDLVRATGFDPRRMPDGRPDLQGNWNGGPGSIFLDGHAGDKLRPNSSASLVIDPPDGKIPYKSWAALKREEFWYGYIDPQAACVSPGVPRHLYNASRGYQLLQTRDRVALVNEWGHVYRVIPLDGRPHLPPAIRQFMGNSRGRWEGDTLVVMTKGFNGKTWLTVSGDFHSDQLEVVERLTPVDIDRIRYEVTLTDPYVYTRPWTMAFDLRRFANPDDEIWEEECHGGNVDFPHMRDLYKGFFGLPR